MNIYSGLLFQQGYIQDPYLAKSLAGVAPGGRSDPLVVGAPLESQHPSAAQPCKPFKRGVITALCSIALSPFR